MISLIFLRIFLQVNDSWWQVYIASGNDLVPSGNKLLSAPVLVKFCDTIHHKSINMGIMQ